MLPDTTCLPTHMPIYLFKGIYTKTVFSPQYLLKLSINQNEEYSVELCEWKEAVMSKLCFIQNDFQLNLCGVLGAL